MLAAPWLLAGVARAATPEAIDKQVLAAARTELQEQAERSGLAEPLFDLMLVKSTRATPSCPQPVVVEGVDTRHPSRMRLAAMCTGADGWRQEFVLRANVSARVLVAAVDVPAGRPLVQADVTLDRRDVTATPDAFSDLQTAAGMSSRRTLHAGDIVRRSSLVAAILVRRGQAVRIIAKSGAVEVTVAGEALEDGSRDAMVRVRNTGNGSVIRARVTGDATVEPAEVVVSTPHSPD
ncbi:MAG TPA: flagellar basal body P-ring formation chaperone FlgA [Burkholderiaceae bacterium]